MENEMLVKILEEIKGSEARMSNRISEEIKNLETKMDNKFAEVDNKIKDIKQEIKDLRKDFNSHDVGTKSAWKDFEDVIGREFEKLNKRLNKHAVKIRFCEQAIEELYIMHEKEINLAEASERYEAGLKKE